MKISRSKRWLSVSIGLGLYIATMSPAVFAAQDEKDSEQSQAELQQKLNDAQKRLDVAAREVAELSMSLSDQVVGHMPMHVIGRHRGALGIGLAPRSEQRSDGVEIVSVSPGGAAAQAGLKPGDVLVELNGESLIGKGEESSHDKLMELMQKVKPDDKVRVRYRRDNKVASAEVVAKPLADRVFHVATAPMGAFGLQGPLPHAAFFRADGVFGSAELVPITPKLGQYFGTDKGLLVVRAPADSRLKIEEGDVILDIDGRTPSSPSHALRILGSYQGGEKLKLGVLRAKKRLTFDVTVPEGPWNHRFERHFGPGHPGEMIGPQDGPNVQFRAPLPPPPPEAGAISMDEETA
jgi:diadenosine tetraphosphate (Ap4A) HIT family hydrolase